MAYDDMTATKMRAIPIRMLLDAIQRTKGPGMVFQPVVAGAVLPIHPLVALEQVSGVWCSIVGW